MPVFFIWLTVHAGCQCIERRSTNAGFVVVQVSKQMPATLSKDELLSMHVKTVDSDWRLDAFEGKNVGFRVDLQVVPNWLAPNHGVDNANNHDPPTP
jgi:hypothetical protein